MGLAKKVVVVTGGAHDAKDQTKDRFHGSHMVPLANLRSP